MIKRNFALSALLGAATLLTAATSQAIVVDLEHNDSGTAGGSPTNPTPQSAALFFETNTQPTGTGYIDPFLRLQANGTEQGYNTSGRIGAQAPLDDKSDPNFTRNITFSDLQSTAVNIGGTSYYAILLDVNEPNGAKSIITLDQLRIYTSQVGSQTGAMPAGTLRYDLDFFTDSQVVIDASRNHGSGSGDVYIYIPASDFAGTAPSDYVYLYALFGQADTVSNPDGSQGGFEEFALVQNIAPVPEMSALFPIVGLLVAVGSTRVLRRRQMAKASV
jgi:hypothetical protein